MPVTEEDLESLDPLLSNGAIVEPNVVYHIYKNRRSRYADVKLWCSSDLGTCRVTPLFLTDNNFSVVPINDFDIKVEKDEDKENFVIA